MLFSTRLAFSDSHDPPDGGRLWFRLASINMALLAEGECPNSNDKLSLLDIYALLSIRAIIAEIRSQSSVSVASCLRPALVIE